MLACLLNVQIIFTKINDHRKALEAVGTVIMLLASKLEACIVLRARFSPM